ncbi:hypothetical protein CIP100294_01648 [Corynebacterium diphtheriae]|nr:hypothetical protein CIP100294_01648 [Corynebacterium diphtheriae]
MCRLRVFHLVLPVGPRLLDWSIDVGKPDDDTEDMRLVGGLVAPHESAVGEVDVDSGVEKRLPQRSDLLALADRIGGNERGFSIRSVHIFGGFAVPARHVIEHTAILAEDGLAVFLLSVVKPRVA